MNGLTRFALGRAFAWTNPPRFRIESERHAPGDALAVDSYETWRFDKQ